MTPKKKAASVTSTAAKKKTNKTVLQYDASAVNRSKDLLSKLEETERLLHEIWMSSQNPDVAYTWLHCVHNLRQVARDLKHASIGEEAA
jgi:hypothetical protein